MCLIVLLFHEGLEISALLSPIPFLLTDPFSILSFLLQPPTHLSPASSFFFSSFHHSQTFPGVISLLGLFRPWTSTRCNNAAIMQLAKEIAGPQLV